MPWSLGCWLLTGLYVSTWTCWRLFNLEDRDLQRGSWCGPLQCCCALFRRSMVTDVMDTSGHSSPIWAYRANVHKMRASHDEDSSNPKDLCSLSVVDLDLSLSLDASASSVTVLGDTPPPVHSPESGAQELLRSAVAEDDEMDTLGGTTDTTDTPATIIPPPPGFQQFSWPSEDWRVGDEPSLFTFTKELMVPMESWGPAG